MTTSRAVTDEMRPGIYHTPIEPFLQAADPTDPNSTPDDLTVFLNVREKSRLVASSGASVGSNDGSVNFNLLLRNLFGGAETFNANAAFGTRTRSAYSAAFDTPVLSKPNVRWEIAGLANATIKSWASHEEALKGGLTKLKWITDNGHQHELSYSGIWRQVTSLAEKASPTVRADAGDSFKSSLTHTWLADRRDNPLLPTRGYLMKTVAELAGFGPLRGDVAFAKLELESQTAIPIPGVSASASGVSLTAGFRAGMLYPLVLGGDANNNNNTPQHSRINDRFTLGGPTDVRGFRHAGLGPRDAADSVGGDVYAAAGASLLLPLPRVGVDVPLRLQFFVNGGRLLALKHDAATSAQSQSQSQSGGSSTSNAMRATIAQLSDGAPSSAAGVGIVYANPMARFELNFSLPLVVRRGEEARKGLSLGVGFSFL